MIDVAVLDIACGLMVLLLLAAFWGRPSAQRRSRCISNFNKTALPNRLESLCESRDLAGNAGREVAQRCGLSRWRVVRGELMSAGARLTMENSDV